MEEMCEYIKSSAPAPGYRGVLLPGEPDHARRNQRMREGIPVDEALCKQIREAAGSVGVKWPDGVVAGQLQP
jgi:uncharacterized oxidoreductase